MGPTSREDLPQKLQVVTRLPRKPPAEEPEELLLPAPSSRRLPRRSPEALERSRSLGPFSSQATAVRRSRIRTMGYRTSDGVDLMNANDCYAGLARPSLDCRRVWGRVQGRGSGFRWQKSEIRRGRGRRSVGWR